MKFAIIVCLSSILLCAKCGLIKDFFGTVSEEANKLAKGNAIVNTVHEIVEVKKGMISDLSNLINPHNYFKPNNNGHANKNIPQQIQPQNTDDNDILVSVSKPPINVNEIIPPLSNKPIPGNGIIPDNSITNSNQEKDQVIPTSTELKPIVFDQNGGNVDINEYEFGIEPRIARQISPYDFDDATLELTDSEKVDTEETHLNKNENAIDNKSFDIVITKENETIVIYTDPSLKSKEVIVTDVVDDCPEGVEMSADGAYVFQLDISLESDE